MPCLHMLTKEGNDLNSKRLHFVVHNKKKKTFLLTQESVPIVLHFNKNIKLMQ